MYMILTLDAYIKCEAFIWFRECLRLVCIAIIKYLESGK